MMKKRTWPILAIVVMGYALNVYRLEINSLRKRIHNLQQMYALYKGEPSTFAGAKDFYPMVKPIVVCGVLQNRNIVLEIGENEFLNVYEESKERMVFDYSHYHKYFIKNGQLNIVGHDKESSLLKNSYFYQDDKDLFLVAPGVLLTNSNCYMSPV